MRSAALPDSRQITSSRQSPKISALSAGVALVPLFEAIPVSESREDVFPASQFHLVIDVPSSDSRSRSPSHQTPKFIEGLVAAICTPRGPRTALGVDCCAVYIPPVLPEAHISYPRKRGSTSSASPRPMSPDACTPKISARVRASRNSAPLGP